MSFYTGWTRQEINALTYREVSEYAEFFFKFEAERMFDFFKAFCLYNAESSAIAFGSDRSKFSQYLNEVRRRKIVLDQKDENDIGDLEDQFKGAGFGK